VGDDEAEVPLRVWGSGERPSKARRRAGVVYREAGPWSPAVLALLRHETRTGVTGTGFPFAWAITWRVRGASWMLTNRSALQRAIG
jgi:hypothetical protein